MSKFFCCLSLSVFSVALNGCVEGQEDPDESLRASHDKGAPADYERIFADDTVHRLDITISASVHEAMQDEMEEMYGEFGAGNNFRMPPHKPPQESLDACVNLQEGDDCSFDDKEGNPLQGICKMPPPPDTELFCFIDFSEGDPGNQGHERPEDPSFFPATVEYEGDIWEYVGLRYKGNSTLHTAWMTGVGKLPFRLDFDEFEDDYPEIEDQRFWGFKKLTFASNFYDDSFLREKICGDMFRQAGVPAAESAFYQVYVDVGAGPVYWGVYTMLEDPANKMLDSQFADGSGNLYKPDGSGSDWTDNFTEGGFEKKTKVEEADWSDVIATIDALNNKSLGDEEWREGLEAHFNVDIFLRWLAIHIIQQNWDAYGRVGKNYYVYGDPSDDGRLVWIPWDLNEAMTDETSHEYSLDFDLDEVGDNFPLIRYLMDDAVYSEIYLAELQNALDGVYDLDPLHGKMEQYHDMLEPYVVGADGEISGFTTLHSEDNFHTSLRGGPDALIDLSEQRHEATQKHLDLY
ncbi:MAG: CotH kinase family protein [Proteobacteria bacterium]|jgi:spore coat protein H|nr:CotH kinase family protein [Pseudomonadota bacterium]